MVNEASTLNTRVQVIGNNNVIAILTITSMWVYRQVIISVHSIVKINSGMYNLCGTPASTVYLFEGIIIICRVPVSILVERLTS